MHNEEIARFTGLDIAIVDILEVILVQYYSCSMSKEDIDMIANELGIDRRYILFMLGYFYHTL